MATELTHVRHDPVLCLAPGLFSSLRRGERKQHKLDVLYEFGKWASIRFVGFEPLAADDLRLLQGLVALAGPEGIHLFPSPADDVACKLRNGLDAQLEAVNETALVVSCTLGKLLSEIGYEDGGAKRKQALGSLRRMAAVTVYVRGLDRYEASYRLLSYVIDTVDGLLYVALNPRLAQAVLGNMQYTHIDMTEVRSLVSDPARLIHQRLCGWIDPGKCRRIKLDTLCGYAWLESASKEAMKKRRQAVRKSLVEIESAGWRVVEGQPGTFSITRPNAPVRPS